MRPFLDHQAPYDEARYVIFPVPYDGTQTFRKGAARGPCFILEASSGLEEYEPETDGEFHRLIHTFPCVEFPLSPEDAVFEVEKGVRRIVGDGKIPVILGGEHTITLGAVKAFEDVIVISFDAHMDMRDEYGGLKICHATVMRRVSEVHPVVLAGVRSWSREEKEWIEQKGIKVYPDVERVLDIKGKSIYISIDLDVFDPSLIPSVGNPEPGGAGWEKMLRVLREVVKKNKVCGLDVVEFTPCPGCEVPAYVVAKLVYKLIGYMERR